MSRHFLLFLFVLIGLSPIFVQAEVYTNRPTTPYELLPMVIEEEGFGEYLGELRGNPFSYEFALATTTVVPMTLFQPRMEQPEPLALLVVRALPTGRVELVERVSLKNGEWVEVDDNWLGMSWWKLPPLSMTLAPGSYRVEVSSPVNHGGFRLVVGEVRWEGYGAMWRRIAGVNNFFDRHKGDWLASWFVLGHLVVALVAYLLLRYKSTWWPAARAVGSWLFVLGRRVYIYGRDRFFS